MGQNKGFCNYSYIRKIKTPVNAYNDVTNGTRGVPVRFGLSLHLQMYIKILCMRAAKGQTSLRI